MARIYFYKLTVDDGGAPCVEDSLLSLAICKPRIRNTAGEDDLIFGFAAKSLDKENRLIYLAKIKVKLTDGTYYIDPRYAARADCIYEFLDGEFQPKTEGQYHGSRDEMEHDIGKPPYPKANVLLSNTYRYFGRLRASDYRYDFPKIKEALQQLTQGHRVNHTKALEEQLM